MLEILPENLKSNWTQHIKKLTFAYNSTLNKAAGFSIFRLPFDHHSILPINYMFDIVDSKDKQIDSYPDFVKKYHLAMKEANNIASRHVIKTQLNVQTWYNKRAYDEDVRTVVIVIVKNASERGDTGKLKSFWEESICKILNKKSSQFMK